MQHEHFNDAFLENLSKTKSEIDIDSIINQSIMDSYSAGFSDGYRKSETDKTKVNKFNRSEIQNTMDNICNLIDELEKENERLKAELLSFQTEAYIKGEVKKIRDANFRYGLSRTEYYEMISWYNEHKKKHIDEELSTKLKAQDGYHIEIEDFPEVTVYSCVCNRCKEMHHLYF